jgi:inner membrane protein
MTGASHAAIGALAGAALGRLSGAPDPLLALAGAAGALLPDLDQPGSKAWRHVLPYAAATIALVHFAAIPVPTQLSALAWLAIAFLAGGILTHHRGITHSLLALGSAGIGLAAAGTGLHGAAIWLGLLTHIAADSLTPEGTRLLWPLMHRYSVPVLRTGSPADIALGAGSAITAALLLLR